MLGRGFFARPSKTSKSEPPLSLIRFSCWPAGWPVLLALAARKRRLIKAATRVASTWTPWDRAKARRSASKSDALGYLWFGSLASALRVMRSSSGGTRGFADDGGGIGRFLIWSTRRSSLSPGNSRSLVSASHRQIPSAKRSERRSTCPRVCSGAMYPILPLMLPVCVWLSLPMALAMPKSISFTCPS